MGGPKLLYALLKDEVGRRDPWVICGWMGMQICIGEEDCTFERSERRGADEGSTCYDLRNLLKAFLKAFF